MRKLYVMLMAIGLCLAIAGCGCKHETWQEADCLTPKTCTACGKTEGEALGHSWTDATCDAPKTCSVCAATEGEALGHIWTDATCTAPKTCSVCAATEGAALGHTWIDATCETAKTCSVCAATEGEVLKHKLVAGTAEEKDDGIHYAGRCVYCNTENLTVTYEDWEAFLEDHITGRWEYSDLLMDGGDYYIPEEYQANFHAEIAEDHTITLSLGGDPLTGSWIYDIYMEDFCVFVFSSEKGLVYLGFEITTDLLYAFAGDTIFVLESTDLMG